MNEVARPEPQAAATIPDNRTLRSNRPCRAAFQIAHEQGGWPGGRISGKPSWPLIPVGLIEQGTETERGDYHTSVLVHRVQMDAPHLEHAISIVLREPSVR